MFVYVCGCGVLNGRLVLRGQSRGLGNLYVQRRDWLPVRFYRKMELCFTWLGKETVAEVFSHKVVGNALRFSLNKPQNAQSHIVIGTRRVSILDGHEAEYDVEWV
jgi:hypothetical protein